MVREVITISVGQAGVQLGQQVWEQYCGEHKVGPNGTRAKTKSDDNSFLCFFQESDGGKYVPRNLMVDLEPNVIDDVKNSTFSKIFDDEYLLAGKEDAANLFARGHFTVGKEMIDKFNDRLRKLVDDCDNVQGFIINHSVGGGTGSGFGALALERMAVDYRKKSKFGFEIYPSPTISTCVVEPYNALLATHWLLDHTEVSVVLDNEAIYEICQRKLDIKRPSYSNINKLITKTVSSITTDLRFEGELNVDLNEFQTNLVPFPRLHFIFTSMAPIATKKKMETMRTDVQAIAESCFSSDSFFVKCADFDAEEDKYMAISVKFRGDVKAKEANATVQWLKTNKKVSFVEWCPTGFKVGLNDFSDDDDTIGLAAGGARDVNNFRSFFDDDEKDENNNVAPKVKQRKGNKKTEHFEAIVGDKVNEEIAKMKRSLVMMGNNTFISRLFAERISKKYDLLYSQRAYVHWYVGEGMEEGEFAEAREDMGFLEKDYLDVLSEQATDEEDWDSDEDDNIGLAAGGARDVNNFRQNNKKIPQLDAITYNGILYEYYFDTKTRKSLQTQGKSKTMGGGGTAGNTQGKMTEGDDGKDEEKEGGNAKSMGGEAGGDTEEKKNEKDISNDNDEEEKKEDNSKLFYPSYCYAKIKKKDFETEDKNDNDDNNADDADDTDDDDDDGAGGDGADGNGGGVNGDGNNGNNNNVGGNGGGAGDNAAVNDADDNVAGVVAVVDTNDNQEYEYYMTVGLNSNIKKNEFKRKHQNLVIVLDISGSMGFGFDFWDKNAKTKMQIANEAVVTLIKKLKPTDRFGLIIFDDIAEIVQRLELMSNVKVDDLFQRILALKSRGGTNFEAGYQAAINLYQELNKDAFNDGEYFNRVIVLTDAQPNIGSTDPNSLLNLVSTYGNSRNNKLSNFIYTTFIGIGLDFNAKLVEIISNVRGGNYYAVKSSEDFIIRMDQEFEYMVTPLVFNVCLKLNVEGNSVKIDKVYGVKQEKEANILKTGEIMRINTLFPSAKSKKKGGTKGGIQLIKLKTLKHVKNVNVEVVVTFEDVNGKKYENKQFVSFEPPELYSVNDMIEDEDENDDQENEKGNFYDNLGIRKAILLCKYVELMRNWIQSNNKDRYTKVIFPKFLKHFNYEMKKCNDETLQKEVKIIEKIINDN